MATMKIRICVFGRIQPQNKLPPFIFMIELAKSNTGFSSEIGTKLRDWAVGQAGGSCYSRAALSSNDSKTLYRHRFVKVSNTNGNENPTFPYQ